MKKLTIAVATFCSPLVLLLSGCSSEPTSNPNLPNPGFTIVTQRRNSLGIESPMPNIIVQGTQRRQLPPEATGTVRDFRGTSSPTVGILPVANGVAPAFWAIGSDNGPCAGQVAFGGVKRGEYNYLTCAVVKLEFPFVFLPFSVSSTDPTGVWTITGTGMEDDYGMPVLQVYDIFGNFVAQMPATECGYTPETDTTPATTWMSGSSAPLMGLPSGSYTVDIWNQTPDGAGAYVGFADFEIYGDETPPDPGPGPCWGYEGMGNGC